MKANLKNGYGISFNEWVLDKRIKNELRLLLIISSLSANKGYCNANNKYFAELFEEDETNISKKIRKLELNNYINVEYEKSGSVVNSRIIRLANLPTAVGKNTNGSNLDYIKNNKERNNIINNIISKESKFKKPSIEEIQEYCIERNNGINANMFYDFYESKGWMIGKNKMKDWKSAIRTWERSNKSLNKETKNERVIPEWFNQEIESTEIDDKDFKEFISEIRK